MIVETVDQSVALLGAQMFVIARAVYMPLYLFAVPYLRPIAWVVGMSGILMMMSSLL
ncbi:MAPEG family protein [Pseudophaeobacter sp.]|uniref:MAPEG family protein n=1 Tax=Pseudophaeobacter sp. TaxID=1971739 RepID=UPI004058D238